MSAGSLTIRELAELVGARLEGDGAALIEGVGSLDDATPRQVTFVSDQRNEPLLAACKAGAAIVGDSVAACATPLLRVKNVQEALAKALAHFSSGDDLPPVGVHPSATIAQHATIGPDVAIGPGVSVGALANVGRGSVLCANVSLGAGVSLGDNTVLFEGVVVRWGCQLGRNVRVGPNSVIGYDGFGYYQSGGSHHRVPHIGGVVIEDDVELGACTCIDRAKFGMTRVGAGTKIDNMVQIAHNVQVGRHCLMAAQVGIAGSTRLGQYVVLGGGAGVKDNITLGNGVQGAAYCAIPQDVPDGQAVAGVPAKPARQQLREWQAMSRLPDMLKKVRELEKRLEAIESAKDH
jgi:UDP-3-O-[3-hydroxymyristoyl] glucosamine N-acyltransferase